MIDVPSMFTVAPRGRTKLLMLLGTFRSLSAHSIVTGRVAALLLVVKATSMAGAIAL